MLALTIASGGPPSVSVVSEVFVPDANNIGSWTIFLTETPVILSTIAAGFVRLSVSAQIISYPSAFVSFSA